jgi:hypothetical protein
MPFDQSDDTWWPNPWPPRTGPGGGAPYPYDWTDPFINARAAALGPPASAPAPFTAAALGAMAWHPPIFLSNGPTSVPGNPSATAWPQQPVSPGGPFGAGSSASVPTTGAPVAPYTLGLGPRLTLAQFGSLLTSDPSFRFGLFGSDPDPTSRFADGSFGAGSSAVAPTTGTPGASYTLGLGPKLSLAQPGSPERALLSSNPSFRFGLFGSDPDPTSPFADGPFGAGGGAAVPSLGTPGATHTLGLGPKLPPLARFQSPVETSAPALDPLIGPANAPAATPPRSVLFNQPPAPWDLDARERDLANLDQTAQSSGISELPISKSGQPIIPPPPPLSTAHEQAVYGARLLSPNLVDYFTKTLPPAPPFPSTPGKILSLDNPYAGPAILEAATWLVPEARMPGMLAGAVERGATAAALQAAKANAASALSVLERLQMHVDSAVARLAADGLTPSQRESLKYYPFFEAAHRGERIDSFAKETIARDENLQHLVITPRFGFGPDIYDPINKVWYDITTPGQWASHVRKYTREFGQGTPLFYGDK